MDYKVIFSCIGADGSEYRARTTAAESLYSVERNQGEHDARFFLLDVVTSAEDAIELCRKYGAHDYLANMGEEYVDFYGDTATLAETPSATE